MKDEIKEIYLSNLEWTKTHDNMGGVMGNLIFKDNFAYEDFQKLLKSGYFILCDKDYITNLEEEKDKYKNVIDKIKEYTKENKKRLYQGRNEFTCEIQYSDEVIEVKDIEKLLEEVE